MAVSVVWGAMRWTPTVFASLVAFAGVIPGAVLRAQGPVPLTPAGPFTVYTAPSIDPNRLPSTGPYPIQFWVVNNDTAHAQAGEFLCSATGPASCGTVTPGLATVPARDSVSVSVTYTTTGSTGGAAVILTAVPDVGQSSSGQRTLTVANAGMAQPRFLNPNVANLDRGLCLTVGAGEAAGVSCGDLFVVQSMPAFRSLGRDRSLALHYNSADATGLLLVPGRLVEPSTIAMPASIRVVLTVSFAGSTFKDSTTYAPPGPSPYCSTSPCAPYSDPQQFVVGRGLPVLSTAYYPATLTVRNIYPAPVGSKDTTIGGLVMVVNRRNSEFGRGWALLGVERFAVDPTDTTRGIWFAGDGSIRLYLKPVGQPNSLIFYGAPGAAPDSLVRFDTLGVKWYRRDLRHGAAVFFDNTGLHQMTRNRAGQRTVFTWDRWPARPGWCRLPSRRSGRLRTLTPWSGTRLPRGWTASSIPQVGGWS